MSRSKLTIKRMLGGIVAVALTLGLGGALAGAAVGGPPPRPPTTEEVPNHVVLPDLPDLDVRDITTPDNDLTVSAMFHNGKVIEVVSPRKVYEVTKANGKGTRIIQGGYFIRQPDGRLAPLPPFDPAWDGVHPTPEQEAEMKRVAGTDKPPPTPPWMPGDTPRP